MGERYVDRYERFKTAVFSNCSGLTMEEQELLSRIFKAFENSLVEEIDIQKDLELLVSGKEYAMIQLLRIFCYEGYIKHKKSKIQTIIASAIWEDEYSNIGEYNRDKIEKIYSEFQKEGVIE